VCTSAAKAGPVCRHFRTGFIRRLRVNIRGIPYLAKNERDMGHPSLVWEREPIRRSSQVGSHADSSARTLQKKGFSAAASRYNELRQYTWVMNLSMSHASSIA